MLTIADPNLPQDQIGKKETNHLLIWTINERRGDTKHLEDTARPLLIVPQTEAGHGIKGLGDANDKI